MADYDWDFSETRTLECCGGLYPSSHLDWCPESSFYPMWLIGVNRIKSAFSESQWWCAGCGVMLPKWMPGNAYNNPSRLHLSKCPDMQAVYTERAQQ